MSGNGRLGCWTSRLIPGLQVQFLEILAPVTVRLTIVQITFLCAYFWDGLYFHIVSLAIYLNAMHGIMQSLSVCPLIIIIILFH